MINTLLRMVMAICLVLISISPAKAMTLETLLERVRHRYAQIQTLMARFEQRNYQSATDNTSWFYGRLYFMKPQNLRIQVNEPDNQIIIVDSYQVYIYIPALKQLTVQSRDLNINSQTLLSMLMGVGDPRQNFIVEWDQKDGPNRKGQRRIALRPRVPQRGLEKIVVAVDSKTYYMVEFIIDDRLGNQQSLALKNIQIDQPLAPDLFQMTIPEGTTVITPKIAPGVKP